MAHPDTIKNILAAVDVAINKIKEDVTTDRKSVV